MVYRYNADDDWQKWKRIQSKTEISIKTDVDWFDKHVFIDKPKNGKGSLRIVRKLMKAIKKDLGFSELQIKKLLRDAGKIGRGKAFVDSMQAEVIEFNVGSYFNGFVTYSDLKKIPFRKMLFWNKIIGVIHNEEQKTIQEAKNRAEATKSRRRRR